MVPSRNGERPVTNDFPLMAAFSAAGLLEGRAPSAPRARTEERRNWRREEFIGGAQVTAHRLAGQASRRRSFLMNGCAATIMEYQSSVEKTEWFAPPGWRFLWPNFLSLQQVHAPDIPI